MLGKATLVIFKITSPIAKPFEANIA